MFPVAQTPYIGCEISLISRLDIRYVGILYSVDITDSTIALSAVRSFGTEDRPSANPVAPRSEIYEYIVFKAGDIKDLVICDTKPKVLACCADNIFGEKSPSRDTHPRPRRSSKSGVPQVVLLGVLNYLQSHEKLHFETDYDFEKANEQFQETLEDLEKLTVEDKEIDGEEKKGDAKEKKEVEKEVFYDKNSSFFDRISCESLEKHDGHALRKNWRKEREINQETFGHQAVRALMRRGGRFSYNRGGYAGYYRNHSNQFSYNGGYNPRYPQYRRNNYFRQPPPTREPKIESDQ